MYSFNREFIIKNSKYSKFLRELDSIRREILGFWIEESVDLVVSFEKGAEFVLEESFGVLALVEAGQGEDSCWVDELGGLVEVLGLLVEFAVGSGG